jgi:thioredoxin 2
MAEPFVVPCSACFALNRVPADRFGDVPVCATCRRHLLGEPPAALGAATFDRFVGRSGLPVVVDFWAAWCGPCRTMAPHFEAASKTLAGRVLFAKVDTEAEPGLAQRFEVRGIPLLVLFRSGREVARQTGAMGEAQIRAWLAGAG